MMPAMMIWITVIVEGKVRISVTVIIIVIGWIAIVPVAQVPCAATQRHWRQKHHRDENDLCVHAITSFLSVSCWATVLGILT